MEISAKELRLGNWISFDGNQFQTLPIDIKNLSNEKLPISNKLYEPIPLTEELLIKMGFEKMGEGFEVDRYVFLEYLFVTIHKSGKANFTLKNNTFSVSLKYVHQLQNLYFALTNEELTIEL